VSENEFCIANINAAGRRRRFALGSVVLLVWVVSSIYFLRERDWPGFLIGLLPLFFAWLCLMQATDRT
jgi:hypothetical protein